MSNSVKNDKYSKAYDSFLFKRGMLKICLFLKKMSKTKKNQYFEGKKNVEKMLNFSRKIFLNTPNKDFSFRKEIEHFLNFSSKYHSFIRKNSDFSFCDHQKKGVKKSEHYEYIARTMREKAFKERKYNEDSVFEKKEKKKSTEEGAFSEFLFFYLRTLDNSLLKKKEVFFLYK